MPDYDTMINMLDRAGIIYSTDWNRETLLGSEKRVVKWIIIPNRIHGIELGTYLKFNIAGGLESIAALTNN